MANNCGRPANLSGPCSGAHSLKLAGVTLNFTRWEAKDGGANRKRFAPKSLAERKPEIPTTTNNTCTSLRLHACSVPPELQISILVHQAAAHLQRSEPLCLLHVLHVQYASSKAPDLHTSMSLRLQRTSRAPEFHTSMRPTRLYTASRAPYLYASHTFLHPQHAFQSSRSLASTRLQRISRTLEANSYTSLHPQHASGSPYLDVPSPAPQLLELRSSGGKHLHVPGPAARRERDAESCDEHEFLD